VLLLAATLNPCVVVYPIEAEVEVAEAVPLVVVLLVPPVQLVEQVTGPVAHLAPVGPPENLPVEIASSVTLPVSVSGAMVSMSSVLAIREWKKNFSVTPLIHPSNTLALILRSMMTFLSRLQALAYQTPLQLSPTHH
jgi:hypothetical protein